ncbi:hypothetical protein D3C86_1467860 [compost metagenome]
MDYELPDGGSLGDIRSLMDLYLTEARPLLLGRRSSTYLWIPAKGEGSHLSEKAVNRILGDISRRFLSDLLPEGLGLLNPHLMRHICASYVLGVHKDLYLAAQMLNDSPTTVYRNYSDILESKKETTKQFLSSLKL